MKENFLKIAAMLIAAMLLVVSCTQEVAPKNEELVEVKIGVGRSSRDIEIDPADGAKITYKYTLTPEWSMVDNGTPIHGAVTTETAIDNKTYGIDDTPSVTTLGLVTPGLWKVTVKGYMNDEAVLEGALKTYFSGSSTSATVFVAPVSNSNEAAKGTLEITLKMQDLGATEKNKINYSITTLGVEGSVSGTIENSTMTDHVGTYGKVTLSNRINAGFNTITFSIPGVKGGITETFLMLPGRTVTITGSVYPSDFVDSPISVSVIDLSTAELAIKNGDEVVGKTDVAVSSAEGATTVEMYVLNNGTEYTFSFTEDADVKGLPSDAGSLRRTYQWYVGSKIIPSATNATATSTALGIKTTSGDYAITCVTTYEFTIDGQDYKIEASATEGKVRVK